MRRLRLTNGPAGYVALALVGLVLALARTWPLVLHAGSQIAEDTGDPLFQAWQVGWVGHAVLHQPLHLFQANLFWPLADSLAFSDALVGYAPAGLIAQFGPHADLVVYNLLFVFAYALAFVGAYLLARELGAGRFSSGAAGVAFAYAPWRTPQNGHLNVLSSGGIPLALFLLVRGYRRRSTGLVVAGWLVAAWQMTLGFNLGLQFVYLLGALAVIATVVWGLGGRPRIPAGLAWGTAGGVLVLALATTLQARPYLRVLDAHPEARRTAAEVALYSPTFHGLVSASSLTSFWGRVIGSADQEQVLFPGLAVLAAAIAGLFVRTYSWRLRIGLAAGIVVCGAFSLGFRDVSGAGRFLWPYRFLYEFAPGWDGLRTPGRINTLTSLGLALLAAGGLTALERRGRIGAALTTGVAIVIFAEGFGSLPHPAVPAPPPAQARATPPELHLPIADSLYAYWSTDGFPRIVNGFGGFRPASYGHVQDAVRNFPDRKSVEVLRALGVRTVVLHPSLAAGTFWEHSARRPVAGLPLTRETLPGVVLFRLEPRR